MRKHNQEKDVPSVTPAHTDPFLSATWRPTCWSTKTKSHSNVMGVIKALDKGSSWKGTRVCTINLPLAGIPAWMIMGKFREEESNSFHVEEVWCGFWAAFFSDCWRTCTVPSNQIRTYPLESWDWHPQIHYSREKVHIKKFKRCHKIARLSVAVVLFKIENSFRSKIGHWWPWSDGQFHL